MTHFEQIKLMSIDEIAEKAVRPIVMPFSKVYMSILDATVYDTEEQTVAHNKKFLESEVQK